MAPSSEGMARVTFMPEGVAKAAKYPGCGEEDVPMAVFGRSDSRTAFVSAPEVWTVSLVVTFTPAAPAESAAG